MFIVLGELEKDIAIIQQDTQQLHKEQLRPSVQFIDYKKEFTQASNQLINNIL